jgi:dihydrofolate synthase/folylpolyglutamate synthase
MEYEEEFNYLDSLTASGIRLGLQRIKEILYLLENPHHKLNTVVIAGTNGKGSTAAIISSILEASGYKVGLFTSPHLDTFLERIKIKGISIPRISAGQLIRIVRQLIEKNTQGLSLTYFEFLTVMALKYFAQEKVDIAILETGMGGKLDATNVVKPLVSVITSIGLDHTNYLGNTLLAIAQEKAGIIKGGGKTVCSQMQPKISHFIR